MNLKSALEKFKSYLGVAKKCTLIKSWLNFLIDILSIRLEYRKIRILIGKRKLHFRKIRLEFGKLGA